MYSKLLHAINWWCTVSLGWLKLGESSCKTSWQMNVWWIYYTTANSDEYKIGNCQIQVWQIYKIKQTTAQVRIIEV